MWTNFTFNQSKVFKDYNLNSIPKLPSGVIRIFLLLLMNIGLLTFTHAAQRVDLVIIDSGLDQSEFQYLTTLVNNDFEILWVNTDTDLNTLFKGVFTRGELYSSIHIISHGRPGTLIFDDNELSLEELEKILQGSTGVTPTDIYFYGCDILSKQGITSIKALEELFPGTNFYGSIDKTGSGQAGSNKILEYSTTGIPSYAVYLEGYEGVNLQCQIDYFAGCDYTVNKIAPPSLIGLLLEGTNFGNLVDSDLNNFVTVNTTASVAGATIASARRISGSFPAGKRTGFVIEPLGAGLLSLDVLEGLQIRTHLNGQFQESATIQSGGLLSLSLLGGGQGGKRRIDFITTQEFDEIELVMTTALAALSSIRIYYGFAEDEECNADCKTAINTVNFPGATAFTCSTLLCPNFSNVGNVVSADTMAFAFRTSLLLESPYVQVNSNTTFPAGTEFGFVVSRDGLLGLLSLDLLNNITVTTRDGNTVVESFNAGASLAGVGLLDGGLTVISFVSNSEFQNIRIAYNVLLSLLGTNRVHYAFIRADSDGDGFPDCIDQCPGGDDAILNSFGQVLDCAPDCNVFAGYDQNISSSLPGTVQLPAAQPGQGWQPLLGNPSPASVGVDGTVTGLDAEGAYLFELTDGSCSDTVTINYVIGFGEPGCNKPMVGSNMTIGSSTFSGACLNCNSSDAENVINGNLNDYSTYNSLLSVGVFTTIISVKDTVDVYDGGTRVGYVLEFGDALLNLNLISSFRLTTYLDGVQQESVISTSGLVGTNAVGIGGGKFRISFETNSDFNEVSLEFANLLGLTLGNELRIYHAFTEPSSCQNGVDPLNDLFEACIEPLTACASNKPIIGYERTGFSGVACSACGLDDLANILDADVNSYATLSLGVGLLVTGSVAVQTEQPFDPGFEVGFAINATPELLSLDVLSDITIKTYQNGTLRETRNGGAGLLNVSLVSGSSAISFVGFTANQTFDEVQLEINSPVSANLLSQLRIYFAYVRMDSDGDGIPDCQDKCLAGDDSIDLNGSGIPDACELTLIAMDDTAGPINGNQGGTAVINVLDNDTIDDQPVDLSVVNLSELDSDGALLLNSDGTVDVLPNTPIGTYTLTYRICEVASPTNCDVGTVTITVSAAEIIAQDDFAGPIDGETGGIGVLNVLENDLLDGMEVTIAQVTVSTLFADAPLILNSNGSVDVAPNTGSGLYVVEYQICEILNPTNCATAIARVNVLGNEEPCEITYLAGCEYLVNRVNANSFISLLLGGTNYNNLIDADLNNFVEVNTTLAVGGTSLGSVKRINGAFPGGLRVGFVIEAIGGGLLNLDVLEGITLRTYLDGNIQEVAVLGSGGLLNLNLIGGTQLSKRRVEFITSTNFDEVEILLGNTLVAFSSVRLYYAFVENESCDADCKTAINTVNFPGATAETCTGFLCPNFINIDNVVSADTIASAFRISLLAEIAYAQVNSNTTFPAGTEFGFVVSRDGLLGLLSLELLNNITVTTRNGNSVVETFNAGANLAGISLLDGGLTVISFKATSAFENVRISYSVLLSLLGTNRVHYAFIRSDMDGDGIPDCIDMCPGGDDTVLNKSGAPLECNPDCTVFAGFDQVVSSSLPGITNLLQAGAGQSWTVDPANPSPATVNQFGEVTGMDLIGTYGFILSDGICSDTVFVNYNRGALPLECNNPMVGPNVEIGSSSFSGVCVLCGASGVGNVISGDLNSYLEYSSLLSLLTSTTLVSVKDTNKVYDAGTRVGYVVEIMDAALNVDLISGFSLTTFLEGVQQENITISNGLLITSAANLGGGKFRISLDANQEFDEVAINYGNVLNLSLGNQIRIYYAFTEPLSCPGDVDPSINPEVICIEYFTSCDGLNPDINYERTGIDGAACVACEITDLANLIDGDPSTHANINLGAGIVVQGSISTVVDQQFDAGFEAGYVIGSAPELLSLDVLSGLTIATYLNGTLQELGTNVSGLLNVAAVVGSTNLGLVSINTTLPFNEIRLIVTAPVSVNLLSSLDVYYPYIRQDSDGDGVPDCMDKCFEGDDNFDSNGNGIPDDCEFIIIANDDDFGPAFGKVGGEIGNVLENDFLAGDLVSPNDVVISIIDFGGIPDASITGEGDFILPLNTPPGMYTLTYRICETIVPDNCDEAFINITVSATLPDFNVTSVNVQVEGNVSTNDTVEDGTSYDMPIANPNNPAGGILELFSDGSYTFISPNVGVYEYSINVCLPDAGPGECIRETLVITVTNQYDENSPPIANPDLGYLLKNSQITLPTLANDAAGQPDRNLVPGSVTIIESPLSGNAFINSGTGDITYVPNIDFIGSDTLRYQVCDDSGTPLCAESFQVFVVFDINAPNTTLAWDDFFVTPVNQQVGGNVMDNDFDPEGDTQMVTPQNLNLGGVGNLTISADGSFTFDPETGVSGAYSFPYEVCDDGITTACARATLHILVLSTIEANDDFEGPVNGNLGIVGLLNVLDNDLFNNQSALGSEIDIEEIIPDPAMALALNPDGTVDLAPLTPGGTYTLTYRICETNNPLNCDTAIVSVMVLETPDYTPTNDIDNLEFMETGTSRDFVINIFEIEGGNQIIGEDITVRISKMSAYTITYPLVSGTSDVLGGVPNNNGDWEFEENTNFIIATLKSGIKINAIESSVIGFNITRKAGVPGNTEQNLTATILFNSGGEINNSNNIVQTTLTAN